MKCKSVDAEEQVGAFASPFLASDAYFNSGGAPDSAWHAEESGKESIN